MSNELTKNNLGSLQNNTNMKFQPFSVEDEYPVENYTRIPLSRLAALGTGFEPIASAIQKVIGGSGASGLYKVTIPSGTHLAEFKSGIGNLGTALNANNQIAGQAVLQPLACNPAMLFMAATLVMIDKKLDAIKELQQDMMEFLEQKEKAELRGDLTFLSDILNNYRFNWNNDKYTNGVYIKVMDIRQTSEQKIEFYRDRIASRLKKKSIVHSDKNAEKQLKKVRAFLKEYQLALYIHGFSSFLDVMLLGNFDSVYLDEIIQKLNSYSVQYRELYTECYDQLETYFDTSAQSFLLKGLETASTKTGEGISKIPVISKSLVDEKLIDTGDFLERYGILRTKKQMEKLRDRYDSCVKPFIESIETVQQLHNAGLNMLFDHDTVYLDVACAT